MTRSDSLLPRAAVLCCVAFTFAACGGGGGSGSGGPGDPAGGTPSMSLSVDGVQATTTDVTAASDGGVAWVAAAAGATTIRLGIPATTPGTFTSAASSGGTVTYLDGAGGVFEASDAVAGSAYSIEVTRSSGARVGGTFTATVVAGGATRALTGTFDAPVPVAVDGKPYEGRYLGIFETTYKVCASTCGPERSTAFRVVLELAWSNAEWQAQKYVVTHASVADPYFGCTSGCSPGATAAFAYLPAPPGTSSSTAWIAVSFPNGRRLETDSGYGQLLTSATGGVVRSGTCGNDACWSGWQQDPLDWSKGWESVALPAGSMFLQQRWWLVKTP